MKRFFKLPRFMVSMLRFQNQAPLANATEPDGKAKGKPDVTGWVLKHKYRKLGNFSVNIIGVFIVQGVLEPHPHTASESHPSHLKPRPPTADPAGLLNFGPFSL